MFTPPAYFALGILGISVIASLSEGSLIKGLMAGVIGLMIATVGTDPLSGVGRFTYGSPELLSGIPFILVMVGVFAVSELLRSEEHTSELQSLMRTSYAVFCLKKKKYYKTQSHSIYKIITST